jgi:dihydroxy-acid dehydratase
MDSDQPINWNSRHVTSGWQKSITAFFWALGFSEADFGKAQVGIGVPLLDGNPCNMHAHELAMAIAESCREAGLLGLPFGTPSVSDNISQGLEGGNASLPSRNLIANSAECVITAHCYDAMIGLHHCDKNGPGFAMALARTNYPGLLVSGGSIMPGCHKGREITILDPYEAHAQVATGKLDAAEADAITRKACPGAGGCGIAASFNTWGMAMEAIGLMLPASSSIPAVSSDKKAECRRIGAAVRGLLEQGIRPRDILTLDAFENAVVTIAAAGGSTNGILHILALAQEAGVDFGLREIQAILRRTPVICSFAPRGSKTMLDLHRLGGTPVLLRHLLDAGLLHGDCLTVSGKTLAQNLANIAAVSLGNGLIWPVESPQKAYADIQICFGNLAPDGIVMKVSSREEPQFAGRAICFDSCESLTRAAESGKIEPGSVCVLRNLGPVASGMPEVLVASAALAVPELDGKVALISDTRVSGVSHGVIGVHCSPEAALGGPIGLVEDGDEIAFHLLDGRIDLRISDAELDRRRAAWTAPNPAVFRGYLYDFAATVTQAQLGCVSQGVLGRNANT